MPSITARTCVLSVVLLVGLLGPCVSGQIGFECQPLGPFQSGDCEGVASSGNSAGTGVFGANACGFPAAGLQHAEIEAFGPILVMPPPGGPLLRPVQGPHEEVTVPIPAGTTQISFCWDFYNGELSFGSPSAMFNDGVDIAVVDAATGALLQSLVYADAFTPTAPSNCTHGVGSPTNQALDSLADGPNAFGATLAAPTTGAEVLSIVVWNATDNLFASGAAIDGIQFGTTGPICGSAAPQPPANEDCATAWNGGFQLSLGANTGFTNAQATASGVVPGCAGAGNHDVWFFFTATSSCPLTIDTLGSGFDTVLAVFDGNGFVPGPGACPGLPQLACNDDASGLATSSVTVPVSAGDLLFIQVSSAAQGFTGPVTVNVNTAFELFVGQIPGPGGPLLIENTCGSPGASYITAITLLPGTFPNGWFYGVDIPWGTFILELAAGPPFHGFLDVSGSSSWSSGAAVPAGLNIFAVSVQFHVGTGALILATAPVFYTTL